MQPPPATANSPDALRDLALRLSESRYRRLFETAQDGILLLNADSAQIEDVNPYLMKMLGYTHAELLGKKLWETGSFADIAQSKEMFSKLQTTGYVRYENLPLKTKAGARIDVEFVSNSYDCEGIKVIQCDVRNISDRVAAEARAERHARLHAALSECNKAIVRCTTEEELFPLVCRIAVQLGGMKMAWIGMADAESRRVRPVGSFGDDAAYVKEIEISWDRDSPFGRGPAGTAIRENQPVWCQDFANDPRTVEWRERGARSGFAASASLPLSRGGAVIGAINVYSGESNVFDEPMRGLLLEMASDISFALDTFARESHRKRLDHELLQSRDRLELATRSAGIGIWDWDVVANELQWDARMYELYGIRQQDFSGAYDAWQKGLHPDDKERGDAATKAAIDGAADFNMDFRVVWPNGEVHHIEAHAVVQHEANGVATRMIGVNWDITERKRAEEDLRAAEEQFRSVLEQTIAGIYIVQDGKFRYLNRRGAEIIGESSADTVIGTDPLKWVVEADRAMVAENMRRLYCGEATNLAFEFGALRRDGMAIQVGLNAARATHDGRPALIGLLQDISAKKRGEQELLRLIEQLHIALMSTVEVVTTICEMRDPYTAGHERRVALIAAAIGNELGFDADRQEGLRIAGQLHDVGKMIIPSEILTKPGKLSALEYQLVQAHAQASYDILKNVKFPWPVAQIALQHHERMDGSGYPQGLKGEAILLDARVLAVADVVEAMSSHRPYRSGLGIEKSLAEIERGRGTAYDPDVADACLKLFRQKGYSIPA